MKIKCIFLLVIETGFATDHRIARYTSPATQVPLGLYPWIVEKIGSGWHKCTGFLISNNHVVTSAHCLNSPSKHMNLTVNFYNNNKYLSVKAKRFISHPGSDTDIKNDIAIVELASPVKIKPSNITLYNYNCPELLMNMSNPIAAGYAGNDTLYAASLAWLTPCRKDNNYRLNYQGYAQPGDSGGPLFFQNMNDTNILGIHWGGGRVNSGIELFLPLSLHQDFINKYIELNKNSSDYQISGTSLLIRDWTNVSETSATSTTSPTSTTSSTSPTSAASPTSVASAVSANHIVNVLLFTILCLSGEYVK